MEKVKTEDRIYYGEGVSLTPEEAARLPNTNVLIAGTTGAGKTFSVVMPRLLYTNQGSLVVPLVKKELREKLIKVFKDRGYDVMSMDFFSPEDSNIGYDPLDYIKDVRDILELARKMVGTVESKDHTGNSDPYWNESATNVLAALIALVIQNAEDEGRKPCFADVVNLHSSMVIDKEDDTFATNIDRLFDRAERRHPGNYASRMWRTIQGLAGKTASCIISIVNNAVIGLATKEILDITKIDKKIDFKELGKKKTILFIRSAPYDKTTTKFINIMYADMFKELFKAAEKKANEHLDIPVHIICDDFACGSRIDNFEEYISVFRSAGISVTLLLQSESQLESMYGRYDAQTIINNCATYIYMGGMDITTCNNISIKINRSVNHILSMPLGSVIIMQCGEKPVETKRYQILNDPLYQHYFAKDPGDLELE